MRIWGVFWRGMKMNNKGQLSFFLMFFLRRLIFTFSVFMINDYAIVQLQLVIYINMIMMIYQGNYQPIASREENQVQLFNEVMIQLVTVHLLFFTDWVSNVNDQFMLGWSMVGWVFYLILVNFMLIFYYASLSLYLLYKKYKSKYDRYKEISIKKKELLEAKKETNNKQIELKTLKTDVPSAIKEKIETSIK